MKMKKMTLSVALLGATFLSACGTTQGSNLLGALPQTKPAGQDKPADATVTPPSAPQGSSLLSGLLGSLLGKSETLTAASIVGTWQYAAPDCVFESENLLMKAGGQVAAAKIEDQVSTQLAKIGIKPGACSFVFKEDGTYAATIGKRTLTGGYTLDAENKVLTITYLAGLGNAEAKVALKKDELSLLFESDKLLKLASAISSLTGSTAGKALGTMLDSYDGLYVGMKLKK